MKLSYTEAILIQRSQLAWYRKAIGRSGTKEIRNRTKPCPQDVHPDHKISIFTINNLVPRGGSIEYLVKRTYQGDNEPTRMAYSEAIRRGLI